MKSTVSKPSFQTVVAVLIVIFGTVAMSVTDGIWQPPYLVKSLIKILFFLLLPIFFLLFQKPHAAQLKALFVPQKKALLVSLILGTAVYAVMLIGYIGVQQIYDINDLVRHTTSQNGVTAHNFLIVSLYISFINSLLEEFFFRGFAFLMLRKHLSLRVAYLFSALTFSLYHVGMIATGQDILISVLSTVGLCIAGLFFNYLDDTYNCILPSWLVHMFANFGINTIGFYILST